MVCRFSVHQKYSWRGVQEPVVVTKIVSKYVSLFTHIFIQDGKLYYVGPKKDEKREVVIEAERKRQIFLDCHFNEFGHHLGQKKTVHRIQSKYYWLGIIKDVVDWVRTFLCLQCYVYISGTFW